MKRALVLQYDGETVVGSTAVSVLNEKDITIGDDQEVVILDD